VHLVFSKHCDLLGCLPDLLVEFVIDGHAELHKTVSNGFVV
jgi:hypothetical protein